MKEQMPAGSGRKGGQKDGLKEELPYRGTETKPAGYLVSPILRKV